MGHLSFGSNKACPRARARRPDLSLFLFPPRERCMEIGIPSAARNHMGPPGEARVTLGLANIRIMLNSIFVNAKKVHNMKVVTKIPTKCRMHVPFHMYMIYLIFKYV